MPQLQSSLQGRSILHLGSGRKYNPNCVNVDLVESTKPDIVHNLDVFPWPLPDDHFQEVWAYDVLEHLDNLILVMEEIHRVCRSGAKVMVTLPHFSSANAFTDITHRHYFSINSFNYFTGENEFDFYTYKRFKKVSGEIVFYPTITNKLVHRFARRWPTSYERRWVWVFPAWFLYFELQVVKP
jgi:SAM-dependent methyltransferase